MAIQLDETDVAILKCLIRDGRKSFRAISREIKVSPPTVKSRYERLVNIGLIKAVKAEIDLSLVDNKNKRVLGPSLQEMQRHGKHFHVRIEGLKVKLKCDFCGGPVYAKAKILKFANFERYFCCTQCRISYKEKHAGRIEMLKEHYKKR